MSIKVMNLVRAAVMPFSTDKLVLMMMASYADDRGGSIFPSASRLSVDCALTTRGLRKSLRRLEASGLLHLLHRGNNSALRTNLYRIDLRQLRRLSAARNGEETEFQSFWGDAKGQGNGVPPYRNAVPRHPEQGSANTSVKENESLSTNADDSGGCERERHVAVLQRVF